MTVSNKDKEMRDSLQLLSPPQNHLRLLTDRQSNIFSKHCEIIRFYDFIFGVGFLYQVRAQTGENNAAHIIIPWSVIETLMFPVFFL